MTTTQLLEIVKERGLTIYIRDGIPILKGPPAKATEKLLAVLRFHRERILETLSRGSNGSNPK